MNDMERRRLRDEFAMAAVTGLIAKRHELSRVVAEDVAKQAYDVADAMLRTRFANPGSQQWYCSLCHSNVDPSEVTFNETHQKCGGPVC